MPSRDELYGPVGQSAEAREHRRRARHRLWVSSLSQRDWARLARQADLVAAGQPQARIEDLDAPRIAAAVIEPWLVGYLSGERIGALRGLAVVVWPKT